MMENTCAEQEKQVFELPGEPAVVINGVPPLNVDPNATASTPMDTPKDTESKKNSGFGKAMEGREVRKMFGKRYYLGKVVKFDEEMNWYRVVYEDGDKEDLEWHELEEVVLPLDINIPLKQLAVQAYKHDKSMSESGDDSSKPRRGRPRGQGSKVKAAELQLKPKKGKVGKRNSAKASSQQGVKSKSGSGRVRKTAETQNQIKTENTVVGVKSGKKRGRPRKIAETKNQIQGESTAAVEAQNLMQSKRKRGRPRKTVGTVNQTVTQDTVVESNQVEKIAISEPGYQTLTENITIENVAVEANALSESQVQTHILGGIPFEAKAIPEPANVLPESQVQTRTLGGISLEAKAIPESGYQPQTENIPGVSIPAETNVYFEFLKNTHMEGITPVEVSSELGHQIQTENSAIESIPFESNALLEEQNLTPRAISIPVEARANSEAAHRPQTENTTVKSIPEAKAFPGI